MRAGNGANARTGQSVATHESRCQIRDMLSRPAETRECLGR